MNAIFNELAARMLQLGCGSYVRDESLQIDVNCKGSVYRVHRLYLFQVRTEAKFVPAAAKNRDQAMTHKDASPCAYVPAEDISDLLARLYREIGISAVAAALEITASKMHNKTETEDPSAAAAALSGKNIAA
jgi:hypothetical protein